MNPDAAPFVPGGGRVTASVCQHLETDGGSNQNEDATKTSPRGRRRHQRGRKKPPRDDTHAQHVATTAAHENHQRQRRTQRRRRRRNAKDPSGGKNEQERRKCISKDKGQGHRGECDQIDEPVEDFPSLVEGLNVFAKEEDGLVPRQPSLAYKLASIMEQERREQRLRAKLAAEEAETNSAAKLTVLNVNDVIKGVERIPSEESEDVVAPEPPACGDDRLQIPNLRVSWTEREQFRMRDRFWKAMREKRSRPQERIPQSSLQLQKLSEPDEDEDISDTSTDTDSLGGDRTQPLCRPPLLSSPYDECDDVTTTAQSEINQGEGVPQNVLDLEQAILVTSHPLHCAVYIHAHAVNGDSVSSQACADKTEAVIMRLLERDPDQLSQWMSQRAGVKEIARVSGDADSLSAPPRRLQSADIDALSPLQLAVLYKQPKIIALLCKNAISGKADEEDEFCRTPLMMACELRHLSCMKAILTNTIPKLDRRERVGLNTAFHFACIGTSTPEEAWGEGWHEGDHSYGVSQSFDTLDTLLNHTTNPMKKKVFQLVNNKRQNLLHIGCINGDVPLVQRLVVESHVVKLPKVFAAKDVSGYKPFLLAILGGHTDLVMYLLSDRSTSGYVSHEAHALVVAALSHSSEMVRLILETECGEDANRALLALIHSIDTWKDDSILSEKGSVHEIIQLLVEMGSVNPHRPCETIETRNGLVVLKHSQKERMTELCSPLVAAARLAEVSALRLMIDSYYHSLSYLKTARRRDPQLRTQPESYFLVIEEKEDEDVFVGLENALVTSMFYLRQSAFESPEESAHASCALLLYERFKSFSAAVNGSGTYARRISQRGLEWLEQVTRCNHLLPEPRPIARHNVLEGFHFQAPTLVYSCPGLESREEVPYCSAAANHMDWSVIFATLPWLRSVRLHCNFLRSTMASSKAPVITTEDTFFLVCQGNERLLAHKSIVSIRCGKLAASIRFNEANSESERCLEVHVDLSPTVAKILLCHIYHGSIAFGLLQDKSQQCRQLLELALLADEYLCPSLMLECEVRLLAASAHGTCICKHCGGGSVLTRNETKCRVHLRCLDDASREDCRGLCQAVGVYDLRVTSFVAPDNSGLINSETALDVIAVGQQLAESSREGCFWLKYTRARAIENCALAFNSGFIDPDDHNSGCLEVPFEAAKMFSIWLVLRDFTSVMTSPSFLRQSDHSDGEEIDEGTLADGYEKDATLLLQMCLQELARNPLS